MTTIATRATKLLLSAQKSSPFSAMCVPWLRKQKSLCPFDASVTATALWLLITLASSSSLSWAAESLPQSGSCLSRTQAEQLWPHSHLYWHTERHCWDVTPVGEYHRHAYLPAAAPNGPQASPHPVNYQVVEKDGGTVWVKPPAKVATYYP